MSNDVGLFGTKVMFLDPRVSYYLYKNITPYKIAQKGKRKQKIKTK